jgi:hypothetical protein
MPAIERPKAKRLRPSRTNRKALLESLPEEQRPVAEQLFLGGMPAVRQAIEKQNADRSSSGEAPIPGAPLLDMAEKLANRVRAAEWRDRAEAAMRDVDELDLRDLRSVVSAADAAARDDEARQLAATLREALVKRVEQEHSAWLAELAATLEVGRVVRALRVSSRPPKAGSPLPHDLATRLVDATTEALTADASPDRWVAVLDALAFSPVRDRVIPASLPPQVHDDLKAAVARLGTRLPKIAHIFSIEPDRNAPRTRPERRKPKGGKPTGGRPGGGRSRAGRDGGRAGQNEGERSKDERAGDDAGPKGPTDAASKEETTEATSAPAHSSPEPALAESEETEPGSEGEPTDPVTGTPLPDPAEDSAATPKPGSGPGADQPAAVVSPGEPAEDPAPPEVPVGEPSPDLAHDEPQGPPTP